MSDSSQKMNNLLERLLQLQPSTIGIRMSIFPQAFWGTIPVLVRGWNLSGILFFVKRNFFRGGWEWKLQKKKSSCKKLKTRVKKLDKFHALPIALKWYFYTWYNYEYIKFQLTVSFLTLSHLRIKTDSILPHLLSITKFEK